MKNIAQESSPLLAVLKSHADTPQEFVQKLHEVGYSLVKTKDLHKQRILASPVSRHYPIREAVARLHSLGATHMKPLKYLVEAGATLTMTTCHQELGLLATSTTAMSSTAPNFYDDYFDISSVVDLAESIELYNQENGYWSNDEILNAELKRYLTQKNVVAENDEDNGYWM